jgi:hypothetical protein
MAAKSPVRKPKNIDLRNRRSGVRIPTGALSEGSGERNLRRHCPPRRRRVGTRWERECGFAEPSEADQGRPEGDSFWPAVRTDALSRTLTWRSIARTSAAQTRGSCSDPGTEDDLWDRRGGRRAAGSGRRRRAPPSRLAETSRRGSGRWPTGGRRRSAVAQAIRTKQAMRSGSRRQPARRAWSSSGRAPVQPAAPSIRRASSSAVMCSKRRCCSGCSDVTPREARMASAWGAARAGARRRSQRRRLSGPGVVRSPSRPSSAASLPPGSTNTRVADERVPATVVPRQQPRAAPSQRAIRRRLADSTLRLARREQVRWQGSCRSEQHRPAERQRPCRNALARR